MGAAGTHCGLDGLGTFFKHLSLYKWEQSLWSSHSQVMHFISCYLWWNKHGPAQGDTDQVHIVTLSTVSAGSSGHDVGGAYVQPQILLEDKILIYGVFLFTHRQSDVKVICQWNVRNKLNSSGGRKELEHGNQVLLWKPFTVYVSMRMLSNSKFHSRFLGSLLHLLPFIL